MKRNPQFVVELPDGKRVRFSLKPRASEPFYFVVFRGRDGQRLERSTHEVSQKRAEASAVQVIKEEYFPEAPVEKCTWEDAIVCLTREMKAQNLRPRTIDDYLLMLGILRKVFPSSSSPTHITPVQAKLVKAK